MKTSVPYKSKAPYLNDGRVPIEEIYASLFRLVRSGYWVASSLYEQEVHVGGRLVSLPIRCFRTRRKGPAIYLLAGIHGEEPAGPVALGRSMDILMNLARKGYSVVVFPLCNPRGYFMDWRYPNEERDHRKGTSVGDLDHLLLDSGLRRRRKPACGEAGAISEYLVWLSHSYPCMLAIDLHEDESLTLPYLYSHGRAGVKDPVAGDVVRLFQKHRIHLAGQGRTRFGESIVNGVVHLEKDGSIDEFLAADRYLYDGIIRTKPPAASVVVVETPTLFAGLDQRVRLHMDVIAGLEGFWRLLEDPRHAVGF